MASPQLYQIPPGSIRFPIVGSFDQYPASGILLAAMFAGLVQPSSATMGVVIAMALQGLKITPWPGRYAIVGTGMSGAMSAGSSW